MALEIPNQDRLYDFEREFSEMFRIAAGLNKYYNISEKDFDFYMPKFKSLIKLFNKKYKNLHLDMIYNREEKNLELGVFINLDDVKNIFSDAASKITGLVSIGAQDFNEVNVSETAKLAEMLKQSLDALYLSYFDPNKGANTFSIQHDKKKKMTEVVCSYDAFLSGPAFGLCAYYALQSFDSKINIYEKCAAFGFVDELTDQEKRGWGKKFAHYFGE